MLKKILKIAAVILVAAAVITAAVLLGIKAKEKKANADYRTQIGNMQIFSNTLDEEMPQTVIHKLVIDHLNSPLPEGKTKKKVIFLGYDGFRADGLENVKDNEESAIMYIKSKGGLYHTFSGGVAGVNEQATSTAPSWMAMLTGGWAAYNGVDNNSQMKNENAETFITYALKNGYSASFTTSWREHTELSYRPDIVNSIIKNQPVEYTHQIDDTATYYQILKYVSKPEGAEKTATQDPDVIFFTIEFTDHEGHNTKFGNQNENYKKACVDADSYGYSIIKTIEERATYNEEDWLIIIATDHGGTEYGHGGQTNYERMTWLACNKPIDITEDYLKYEVK